MTTNLEWIIAITVVLWLFLIFAGLKWKKYDEIETRNGTVEKDTKLKITWRFYTLFISLLLSLPFVLYYLNDMPPIIAKFKSIPIISAAIVVIGPFIKIDKIKIPYMGSKFLKIILFALIGPLIWGLLGLLIVDPGYFSKSPK